MITFESYEKFYAHVIAQEDDNDWQESGWVAVVVDDRAALSAYSHCSCDGTWDEIRDNGGNWDWEGTIPELITMAQKKADPHMPGREMVHSDYQFRHLDEVYRQIIEWAMKEGHIEKPKPKKKKKKVVAKKTKKKTAKKKTAKKRVTKKPKKGTLVIPKLPKFDFDL